MDWTLHCANCYLDLRRMRRNSLSMQNNEVRTVNTRMDITYHKRRYRIRPEKRRMAAWGMRESRAHAAFANLSRSDTAMQAALGLDSYPRHARIIFAAAARQAIAATQQQMAPHGRPSMAMKALYEAAAGRELSHPTIHQSHHTHHDHGHGIPSAHSQNTTSSTSNKRHNKQNINANIVNNVGIEEPMEEDCTYDPNEPRCCICNQVSYGDMVACDNQDCRRNRTHRKN